ncbi:hypothetical protein ACA040_000074 [Xenophilus aerolatus]
MTPEQSIAEALKTALDKLNRSSLRPLRDLCDLCVRLSDFALAGNTFKP